MKALFALLSTRHLRRHWVRTLTCVVSIMLGVAIFVSTEVAHESAVHAYEVGVARMAGRAEVRITRGRGIGVERALVERVEALGMQAAPVVEGSVALPDHPREGRLLLLGIDFRRERALRDHALVEATDVDPLRLLADPLAVLVTDAFAERNGLETGDTLRVGTAAATRALTVAGRLSDEGPAAVFGGGIALVRIDGAQDLFVRGSRVDRIDVAPAGDEGEAIAALRATLGEGYRIEPIRAENKTLDDMLGQLRALSVLSVIGLLVGLFIVYLSVSIGVIERGKAIGTARALGASRKQILGLFLVEAGLLGLVGSVLGVLFGWLLARSFVGVIADAVNQLVRLVQVEEVVLPPHALVGGLLAGTLASILAAYFPARRAGRIAPTEALRPAVIGTRLLPNYGRAFLAGLGLVAVGAFVTAALQLRMPPWVGLTAMSVLFLGVALMLPQLTIWISSRLRAPLRRWFRTSGFLAADSVLRYPQRSALTVVALGGALALMVTSASLVASFRHATNQWMVTALPFDLSVQPAKLSNTVYSNATIAPEVMERVRGADGVDRVYAVRATIQEHEDHDVLVLGVDMATYRDVLQKRGLDLGGKRAGPNADADIIAGRTVGVSRNFEALTGIGPGDTLTLRTARGPHDFLVSHATEDYSWPRGAIAMDRSLFRTWWEDDALTYVDVSIAPGRDRDEVRANVLAALGDDVQAFVYTNDDIRAYATNAIEQTFLLVNAQVAMASLIGFLGIFNTLLISVLRRQREIGLLRAVGMPRVQVGRMIAIEAVFVALVGGAFGIIAGLVAAAFPAANHLLLITGYALPFVVPVGTLLVTLGAATVIGVIASVIPARRAMRIDVLEAVGYE